MSKKDFLFYFWQWTWGLTVNLPGAIAYLYCTKIKKYDHDKIGYSNIVYIPWNQGGLSLGTFIFMRKEDVNKKWRYNTRIHEYGHTWQCLLLGPFYWIAVGLPSFIWCNVFGSYRKKHNISYYKLYCESWANKLGQKRSGMKMEPENQ